MHRDDDKQLWDLLGQSKPMEPSPFFARNVLRRIRQEPAWPLRLRSWLHLRRLVPATAALAVALVAGAMWTHRPDARKQTAVDNDPIAKIDPQDYEVVADLDNLLAAEDNNLWDADDNSTL